MSVPRKTAIVIALVLVVFVIYRVMSAGIVATGSGGLGAVSVGLSEALVEVSILAVVAAVFIGGWRWWQRRRSRAGTRH